MMYESEAAVEAAIRALGAGVLVFPLDYPSTGVLGYVVDREDDPPDVLPGEENIFTWPVYGRELEVDNRQASAQQLVDFASSEPFAMVLPIIDARARTFGLVSYRQAVSHNLAMIRWMPHTDLARYQGSRTRFEDLHPVLRRMFSLHNAMSQQRREQAVGLSTRVESRVDVLDGHASEQNQPIPTTTAPPERQGPRRSRWDQFDAFEED